MPSRVPRTLLAVLLVERGWTAEKLCRVFAQTAASLKVRTTDVSLRQARRWIAAENHPQPPAARVLEQIFGTPIDELLAPPALAVPPAVSESPAGIYSEFRPEEEPTDRRDFLGLAALSLTAVDVLQRSPAGRDALTIADLESDIDEVAGVYSRLPPGQVLPIVAAGWDTTKALLSQEDVGTSDERRLTLLAGQFSYFIGRVAFAQGRYRESRRFTEASNYYARKIDDPTLLASLAALRSSISFYTGRYIDAAEYAGQGRLAAPPYMIARLAAYEARGWSAVKRIDLAADALTAMRAAIVDSPHVAGSSPFTHASADMFAAVCFVRIRDGQAAEPYAHAAVQRLAETGSNYEERCHALLALANSHLLRERPDPAAAAAAGTRAVDLPPGHVTSSVAAAAGRLWRRLADWQDDPDIVRFGQLTQSARSALPPGGFS